MKDKINWVYDHYIAQNPPLTPGSVGWSDKESQCERFRVIFSFIEDGSSVLDFGCGLGHLNDFIKEINYNIDYFGIDINPKYVMDAFQLYPDKKFFCCDIEEIDDKFDYVIGSGVFNWIITIEDVVKKIESAHNLSKKGTIFNFLDKKFGLDQLNLYDAEDMKKRLSHIGEVEIISGYLGDEDFTVYLKK